MPARRHRRPSTGLPHALAPASKFIAPFIYHIAAHPAALPALHYHLLLPPIAAAIYPIAHRRSLLPSLPPAIITTFIFIQQQQQQQQQSPAFGTKLIIQAAIQHCRRYHSLLHLLHSLFVICCGSQVKSS